ncbi:helix-turn-helix domain-containing protein [Pseudomonas sp. S36]|uniref:helix-turn-helix domain-containing protein n=1 Tax=Pseudomonas sp. S36 TaxID=2767447 RepID=UPI0019115F2C|nr:AraC family transcriptional regulator [Pseudomonas sp. S36]MBK4989967.1 helix-turn-helix domain-containing protein [Pseudomonas sp. S36]
MKTNQAHGWKGDLWLGDDYCLLLGSPGRTDTHAHYAHQVMMGIDADVQVNLEGQHQRGRQVLIASQQPHAILNDEVQCLTLFAEPLAFDLPDLQWLCERAAGSPAQLVRSLEQWPRRLLDPRLQKALGHIRALGDQPLLARDLASSTALSLSQLERLFSGRLKLSVRRLVLWQRLRIALRLALEGSSLTDAAVAAGFADSAHFTRTVRRQFGLNPGTALRHLSLRTLA